MNVSQRRLMLCNNDSVGWLNCSLRRDYRISTNENILCIIIINIITKIIMRHVINELLRRTCFFILDMNMDISSFSNFCSSMQKNIGIAKIGYIFHILTFFICYWIDSVTSFRYEWKSMQNNTIERCINIHGWHNIYISQWIKFNISWLFLFFDFWQHYNKKSMFRSLCCTHFNWINAEYLIIILHQSLLSISCL